MFATAQASEPTSSPSFDCEKAVSKAELMICASPDLGALDSDMSELYAKAVAEPSKWHKRLQANWLAQRDKCSDVACMAATYKARTQQLDAIKYLDWDNEGAYKSVLDISKDQGALIRGQQIWRQTLDRCADFACVQRAYADRNAELASLGKTVPKAKLRRYVNDALGIGFDFLENRKVVPCEQPNCVELRGAAMGEGSTSILEISVMNGNLASTAGSMWKRDGKKWFATGRNAEAAEVQPYTNGWKGLHATTMCGFHDRNGFHAAGECNTYLRSNGKRAIIVRDDGVSGKDPASAATISSIHFLR